MLPLFRQAVDSQLTGSPAYLDSLRHLYEDDQTSGLIEVQLGEQRQLTLVYAQGLLLGAYQLLPDQVTCLPDDAISQEWGKGDAPIRTCYLPPHAVRAAWLAVESYPAKKVETVEAHQLADSLMAYSLLRRTGLIYLTSMAADGFMFLWNGNSVSAEAVFSISNGFISGLPTNRQDLLIPGSSWQIAYYEPDPNAESYRHLLLRLAASNWTNSALDRYQMMVGQRLLQTLSDDLNSMIQPKGWNIRLVGARLLDHHLFVQMERLAQAYHAILRVTAEQVAQVVGGILAQRMWNEPYNQLSIVERQALEAQALTPVILG